MSSLEACSPTVFSEGDAGKKTLRTAGTGVVLLVPVFTLLGAFSVLYATASSNKGVLGESEVRTFGGAGLLCGEVSLLDENIQSKIIISQKEYIMHIYGLHHYKGKLSFLSV
jgi:hypothetical protein